MELQKKKCQTCGAEILLAQDPCPECGWSPRAEEPPEFLANELISEIDKSKLSGNPAEWIGQRIRLRCIIREVPRGQWDLWTGDALLTGPGMLGGDRISASFVPEETLDGVLDDLQKDKTEVIVEGKCVGLDEANLIRMVHCDLRQWPAYPATIVGEKDALEE